VDRLRDPSRKTRLEKLSSWMIITLRRIDSSPSSRNPESVPEPRDRSRAPRDRSRESQDRSRESQDRSRSPRDRSRGRWGLNSCVLGGVSYFDLEFFVGVLWGSEVRPPSPKQDPSNCSWIFFVGGLLNVYVYICSAKQILQYLKLIYVASENE